MILYLEGTDVIGHVFASDVPPRLELRVGRGLPAVHSGTVDVYYALVDRLLGQWMRRAEEDGATLIVNSDHGFKWGDRPVLRALVAEPGDRGLLAPDRRRFRGLGRASEERAPRGGKASVFDVAPTVAALLGLPVDRRATGSADPGRIPRPRRAGAEGPRRRDSGSRAWPPSRCRRRRRASTRRS